VDVLLLVIQGGVTVQRDSSLGRSIDFRTFSSNLANVAELHFHSAAGRWALRQVPCPDLTAHAYQILCQVNPVPVSLDSLVVEPSLRPLSPPSPSSSSTFPTHLPVAVVPLLTTQSPGSEFRTYSLANNQGMMFAMCLAHEGREPTGSSKLMIAPTWSGVYCR
jgi:hypothetical protein